MTLKHILYHQRIEQTLPVESCTLTFMNTKQAIAPYSECTNKEKQLYFLYKRLLEYYHLDVIFQF